MATPKTSPPTYEPTYEELLDENRWLKEEQNALVPQAGGYHRMPTVQQDPNVPEEIERTPSWLAPPLPAPPGIGTDGQIEAFRSPVPKHAGIEPELGKGPHPGLNPQGHAMEDALAQQMSEGAQAGTDRRTREAIEAERIEAIIALHGKDTRGMDTSHLGSPEAFVEHNTRMHESDAAAVARMDEWSAMNEAEQARIALSDQKAAQYGGVDSAGRFPADRPGSRRLRMSKLNDEQKMALAEKIQEAKRDSGAISQDEFDEWKVELDKARDKARNKSSTLSVQESTNSGRLPQADKFSTEAQDNREKVQNEQDYKAVDEAIDRMIYVSGNRGQLVGIPESVLRGNPDLFDEAQIAVQPGSREGVEDTRSRERARREIRQQLADPELMAQEAEDAARITVGPSAGDRRNKALHERNMEAFADAGKGGKSVDRFRAGLEKRRAEKAKKDEAAALAAGETTHEQDVELAGAAEAQRGKAFVAVEKMRHELGLAKLVSEEAIQKSKAAVDKYTADQGYNEVELQEIGENGRALLEVSVSLVENMSFGEERVGGIKALNTYTDARRAWASAKKRGGKKRDARAVLATASKDFTDYLVLTGQLDPQQAPSFRRSLNQ
jgi:hypothetical protein